MITRRKYDIEKKYRKMTAHHGWAPKKILIFRMSKMPVSSL